MKTLRISIPVAVLASTALASGLAAQAQSEVPPEGEGPYEPHPEAAEAISELKSPYCPGLMLEVCPSPGGAALRDSIQDLATEEGWDSERLVEWVLGRHGEEYRALPKKEGAALLAWIIPPLAVALGIGVVVLALVKMRGRRSDVADSGADISPEDEEKLKEALRELEAEEETPFL